MKSIILTLFLLIACNSYCQDTIKTRSGEVIIAKVLEINIKDIKYKKYSNLEGPIFTLDKKEVNNITFKNGEKEIFNYGQNADLYSGKGNNIELFKILTEKNNKVYIDCEDSNVIIHAKNAIEKWGYWSIASDKNGADFILYFKITWRRGNAFGNANFINPENGEIIKSTRVLNTVYDLDFNAKRGLVNMILEKEIKPMFSNK